MRLYTTKKMEWKASLPIVRCAKAFILRGARPIQGEEELDRIEQAKQIRSIYWHVSLKEKATRPKAPATRISNIRQQAPIPTGTVADPTQPQPKSWRGI
jgi:hypothetical protein